MASSIGVMLIVCSCVIALVVFLPRVLVNVIRFVTMLLIVISIMVPFRRCNAASIASVGAILILRLAKKSLSFVSMARFLMAL